MSNAVAARFVLFLEVENQTVLYFSLDFINNRAKVLYLNSRNEYTSILKTLK
jgi:hypothetical protein